MGARFKIWPHQNYVTTVLYLLFLWVSLHGAHTSAKLSFAITAHFLYVTNLVRIWLGIWNNRHMLPFQCTVGSMADSFPGLPKDSIPSSDYWLCDLGWVTGSLWNEGFNQMICKVPSGSKMTLELALNLTWVRWYGDQGVRTLGQEFNPCEFYSVLHMVTCNCCLHHITPCRRLWVTQTSVRRAPDSCLRRIISLEKYNRKVKRLHTKQYVCMCVHTHIVIKGSSAECEKKLRSVCTRATPTAPKLCEHLFCTSIFPGSCTFIN